MIITIGISAFFFWGTYEEGVMVGKMLRISQKSIIFKTYNGKLNLETFGALKGTSPIAETFDFFVESNNKESIKQLEEFFLSGEHINLHYKSVI